MPSNGLRKVYGATPAAAGIDTLLYWETGKSGWRSADRLLRQAYPAVEKSVISPNALYGAMAI